MEANYYELLSDNQVKCFLCPNFCRIPDGGAGICAVRKNKQGKLYAAGYGRIAASALDKIEKKPLYQFHPGTMIYSVGGMGCNLDCNYCQNHAISKEIPPTEAVSPSELILRALYMKNQGNIGIAFTYNEPLINIEFVLDTFRLAKKEHLKTVLVTNGYVTTEPLQDLLPYVDAMNIDLKAFDEDAFYSCCKGKLSYVMETISACFQRCHVEVTTLMVPGLMDDLDGIDALSSWLAELSPDIPFHISRFFPRYKMRKERPTGLDLMDKACHQAKKYLNHVYLGNI